MPENNVGAPSMESRPLNVKKIIRRTGQAITAITVFGGLMYGGYASSGGETKTEIGSAEAVDNPRLPIRTRDADIREAQEIHKNQQKAAAVQRLQQLKHEQYEKTLLYWQYAQNVNVLKQAAQKSALSSQVAHIGRIAYDPARWLHLHQCEQADTWHAGGHFGNGLLSSGGGLGMSMDAWHMAVRDAAKRGVSLPPTAWNASIDQQMQAAQVFWEDEGWGWSCRPYEK